LKKWNLGFFAYRREIFSSLLEKSQLETFPESLLLLRTEPRLWADEMWSLTAASDGVAGRRNPRKREGENRIPGIE
jgi:hypothetical protein